MGSFDQVVHGSEGDQRKSTLNRGPHGLGTLLQFGDGRAFRYVKNGGTAMLPGKLYQRKVPGANYDELVIPTAQAAGATSITVTNGATAVTLNQFKDGWLGVEDDTGEGYNYLIASNTADSGTGAVTVVLADALGLKEAITTSTTVGLYENKYDAVIVHPSPPTSAVAGVATHAMPASYYGWVQVRGECQVLIDGTVVIGKSVMPSTNTDGAVMAWALTEATPNTEIGTIVGIVSEVAATTEYGLIDLKLA